MADLARRLTIVERFLRRSYPGVLTILLVHDPDGLTENDAQAGEFKYRRMPGESVAQFRDRAAKDAEQHRVSTIFFGHGELTL